jgi:hypothetical protein
MVGWIEAIDRAGTRRQIEAALGLLLHVMNPKPRNKVEKRKKGEQNKQQRSATGQLVAADTESAKRERELKVGWGNRCVTESKQAKKNW